MEVNQLTKISLAWELFGSGTSKSHIASHLQVNRETVHIWLENIQRHGLLDFLEQYTNAKKGRRVKRKADGLLKTRIFRLREKTENVVVKKSGSFCLMSMVLGSQ